MLNSLLEFPFTLVRLSMYVNITVFYCCFVSYFPLLSLQVDCFPPDFSLAWLNYYPPIENSSSNKPSVKDNHGFHASNSPPHHSTSGVIYSSLTRGHEGYRLPFKQSMVGCVSERHDYASESTKLGGTSNKNWAQDRHCWASRDSKQDNHSWSRRDAKVLYKAFEEKELCHSWS